VLAHAKKFHAAHLIVSPAQYFLQETMGLKEEALTQYFIDQVNTSDESHVASLSDILASKSDAVKQQLFNKFDTVTYDVKTGAGYALLKALVASAVSFQNKAEGSSLLLNKVNIKTEKGGSINRLDLVNCSSETVYFGKDNEYKVTLAEIFTNGELQYKEHFDALIAKLSEDKVASAAELQHVFDLTTEDTVSDLLSALNHHLAKTNTSASGAQLSFVLLCKVFINS
jgi:seryl-tRNA synthetase